MSTIVVGEDLCRQLQGLDHSVDMVDPQGKVLGKFIPTLNADDFEGLEPKISAEEARRRLERRSKTFTTQEVLKHLESL